VPFVALFARFERPRHARSGTGTATLRAALGTAGVILGLLGVAVGGIWPLPGTAAELAGLRISPGAGLLCLGVGVALLGRGRLGR
jgi:hypothetical protein